MDHHIMELYNVLIQVRFTTSKAKLVIKLDIRVASQFAKRLKTQGLRKVGCLIISNLGGDIASCQVSLPQIKLQ